MRTLEVFLNNKHIGQIVENRKGARFSYDDAVAEQLAGLPVLSLLFPARKKPFDEEKTASWFNGLLPEGARREAIAKNLGVSQFDWIGILAKIGWECAGAVSVCEKSDSISLQNGYEELSESDLRRRLTSMSQRLPSLESGLFRMSLGGYQEKMCIAMPKLPEDGDAVCSGKLLLPKGGAPSTHILKPENPIYPGSARSEAWAMEVARHAALCARCALLNIADAPSTLVIERYDRSGDPWPNNVRRTHQEDMCQALGLPPSKKYANAKVPKGDDPSYKKLTKLLFAHAAEPERELVELLRQLTVNLVLGNWDAHAKNTSLLYAEAFTPTLAPLYDVVPIAEVEPRTSALSMRVGDVIDPGKVDRGALLREAKSWGLGSHKAGTAIDECLAGLRAGLDAAAVLYPDAANKHETAALKRMHILSRG